MNTTWNFGRGFPRYVQRFNRAFLALPALPSKVLTDAASDREVVVRAIRTSRHGVYLSIVNTGWNSKHRVTIRLSIDGTVTDATDGRALDA